MSTPTAEQRIAEELHELESLAAALLTARNSIRDKAKDLYTSVQVGDYQASEAELVAAPLRRRIKELEEDNLRYRKAHVCIESCTPNAHSAFTGKGLVAELEAQNADLRKQIEELKQAAPAECLTVGRLTRQLDVAHSQVSALQRRKEELHGRVADLVEWLEQSRAEVERLEAVLASRDAALAEMKAVAAGRTEQVDRLNVRNATLSQERDAQQRAKQDAWERLATIEKIVSSSVVDNALNTQATPSYAQTLKLVIRQVREALEGFS